MIYTIRLRFLSRMRIYVSVVCIMDVAICQGGVSRNGVDEPPLRESLRHSTVYYHDLGHLNLPLVYHCVNLTLFSKKLWVNYRAIRLLCGEILRGQCEKDECYGRITRANTKSAFAGDGTAEIREIRCIVLKRAKRLSSQCFWLMGSVCTMKRKILRI
jgi:hypothetical protein